MPKKGMSLAWAGPEKFSRRERPKRGSTCLLGMLGIGGDRGFLLVVLHWIWYGVYDLVGASEMGVEFLCKEGRGAPMPVPHTQVIF